MAGQRVIRFAPANIRRSIELLVVVRYQADEDRNGGRSQVSECLYASRRTIGFSYRPAAALHVQGAYLGKWVQLALHWTPLPAGT